MSARVGAGRAATILITYEAIQLASERGPELRRVERLRARVQELEDNLLPEAEMCGTRWDYSRLLIERREAIVELDWLTGGGL